MPDAANPTLMGVDVIFVATLLAAIATMAVLVAIYAATTVRDPMARRVKALNERREQLKAGIVASTNKRKSLINKNQAADKVRGILSSFKMLQDSQLQYDHVRENICLDHAVWIGPATRANQQEHVGREARVHHRPGQHKYR